MIIINDEKIKIDELIVGKIYSKKVSRKNEILLLEKYHDLYIGVYILDNNLYYSLDDLEKIYKQFIKVYQMCLKVNLNKKVFKITSISYIYNPFKLKVDYKKLFATDTLYKDININEFDHKLNIFELVMKNKIYTYKFKIDDIINNETNINNKVRITIKVNNIDINYSLKVIWKITYME